MPWPLRAALLLCLAACAGAPTPSGPRERPCHARADCGAEVCWPPGLPACGGALSSVLPPEGGCPPARPHWAATGCRYECVAELPVSCAAGWACTHGATCRPGAGGADVHGCVHAPCTSDAECAGGRCVESRCFDALGTCGTMPAAAVQSGVYAPPDPEPPPPPPLPPPPPPPPQQTLARWHHVSAPWARLDGAILDVARLRVYVGDPLTGGRPVEAGTLLGIAAVDARTGAVAWRTHEPWWPMAVSGTSLVAGREGALVLVDGATGRTVSACAGPVPVPSDGPRSSTGAWLWPDDAGLFLIVSGTTRWWGGMAPPPGTPTSETHAQAYPVTVAASTCALGAAAPSPASPEPDREVRFRNVAGEAEISVVVQGRETVLGRFPQGSVDPTESADGADIVLRVRTTSTDALAVFDLASGRRVTDVVLPPGTRTASVVGAVVVWTSPVAVGALELATGRALWQHDLRPRVIRVISPPP